MSDFWANLSPKLVDMLHSLAAEDMTQPLAPGHVEWMNRSISFIGPDTMTGIYVKITRVTSDGKVALTPVKDADNNIRHLEVKRGKFTLQIQAKSLEDTDFSWALHWLDNICVNIWDPAARAYMREMGIAINTIGDIVNHDAPADWRMASIATLEIVFNYCETPTIANVYSFIEHVRGLARATSGATIHEVSFSADKPAG